MRDGSRTSTPSSARVSIFFEESAAVEEALAPCKRGALAPHPIRGIVEASKVAVKMREGWPQTLARTTTEFARAARDLMGNEGQVQALAFQAHVPVEAVGHHRPAESTHRS